ncbi:uracil-DNA glycosylase family protein, putative [Babesia bigemina]|uniref:Uracil-DNA glycosylase n=1 Tax=Babesia bigemina TaxID=5866 RepID=A0A061D8B8_BABBI|nr:uracil-DNA glycosylase family protein, putative [Babesia bigemina]CDR96936.1 uracil-DNA glycosylase family protein, putative [Babesia bigemina]|eukprot:XP_012769122.1 uracil-DNA glycosylase family protein, putative [Babesia bigemina]
MAKRLLTDFFSPLKGCAKRSRSSLDAVADTLTPETAATPEAPPKPDPVETTTATAKDPAPIATSAPAVEDSDANRGVVATVQAMLGDEWGSKLSDELSKPYFEKLWTKVANERKTKKVYPPENLVFNAFKLVPLSKVKVVIVGQDPYHQPRQAMGLAFSVPRGVAPPPSLRNIFKEIGSPSTHGDLTYWARQGVFMLNTVLTVVDSEPLSHSNYGWDAFTDRVIDVINKHREKVVFLLWGKSAQKKCDSISNTRHCVLKCGHPSPLSQKFFLGCDHFNKCNAYLTKTEQSPIDWKLPP